jgi:hypothetical protein
MKQNTKLQYVKLRLVQQQKIFAVFFQEKKITFCKAQTKNKSLLLTAMKCPNNMTNFENVHSSKMPN